LIVRASLGLAKVFAGLLLAVAIFVAGVLFQVRGALPPYCAASASIALHRIVSQRSRPVPAASSRPTPPA
jgi:hypothetical protein